jgi:hypothetical protein
MSPEVAATSTTEQAEVNVEPKAGANVVQPTPIAAPIVKSHPLTTQQRDRIEKNRRAALARRAARRAQRASGP